MRVCFLVIHVVTHFPVQCHFLNLHVVDFIFSYTSIYYFLNILFELKVDLLSFYLEK